MYERIHSLLERAELAEKTLIEASQGILEIVHECDRMSFPGSDTLCLGMWHQLDELTYVMAAEIAAKIRGIRILNNYMVFRETFKHVEHATLAGIVGRDTPGVKWILAGQGMGVDEIYELVQSVRDTWKKYFAGFSMEDVIREINAMEKFDPNTDAGEGEGAS